MQKAGETVWASQGSPSDGDGRAAVAETPPAETPPPEAVTTPEIRALIGMVEKLESNLPFSQILEMVFESFRPYIPYMHIGVALLEEEGRIIRAAYGVTEKHHPNLAKKLMGCQARLADTSLAQVIQSGNPRIINDLPRYLAGRPLTEYNRLLLEAGVRASITFPLYHNGSPVGIIFFSSGQASVYTPQHLRFLHLLANSLMLSLEKTIFIDDMIVGSSLALATLAEERDDSTGGHLQRMKRYSRFIAELLSRQPAYSDRVDFDYIRSIERFSPLHDIGKVAIPDRILLKPGRLTPEEFEIMKTHTTYGARVLRMADENIRKIGRSVFQIGIEIAESHHERWDGQGYPHGLSGTAIPLSARIVAVADVLDALTSERVYKKAYDFDASMNSIIDSAGRQFDPDIIRVIRPHREELRALYRRCRQTPAETVSGPR